MKKYVITGGPGIGKTTIIEILASMGYIIVPEVARLVAEEETIKGTDVLPWKNIEKFQELVAARQIELESTIHADEVFLDRSLIDGSAYCKLNNVQIPQLIAENGKGRYTKIFLLEPLPNYIKDDTRVEEPEHATAIHAAIINTYIEFGYEIIDVPILQPKERVDFILKNI